MLYAVVSSISKKRIVKHELSLIYEEEWCLLHDGMSEVEEWDEEKAADCDEQS